MSVSDNLIVPPLCKGRKPPFKDMRAVVGLQLNIKATERLQCAQHIVCGANKKRNRLTITDKNM